VVSTTLYIYKDIPALHLLGSKKWWSKKYLVRFGVESCDLTVKEAEANLDLCLKSMERVRKEIQQRVLGEKDENKKEMLEMLIGVWGFSG